MKNQILRGVQLGNATIQNDDLRIDIKCDYTDAIREEMEWDEPGPKMQMMMFDDEFGSGRFKLKSDQKNLEGDDTEIAIPFDSASGFRAVKVKEKGKDSTYWQLRFHVCSSAPGMAQMCSDYKRVVKKGLGQMKLTTGEPKVEEIPPPIVADRVSNVAGMAAGKRGPGRPRKTLEAAVAAENASVSGDPDEAERVAAAIEGSLQ